MEANTPLSETEQAQLIEIMQIFMQLPERENLELHLFADASGSVYKNDKLDEHFHNLEEGVHLLRWYANPEIDQEEDEASLIHAQAEQTARPAVNYDECADNDALFLEPDPTLE